MKYIKIDSKGVKCQMTEIGFVPSDDLATLDALLDAVSSAYASNFEIWDAINKVTLTLKAVAEKINGVDDSYIN
jgi:hypothetical protein